MKDSLIMLDLDGTLIDSRADLATAVNLARSSCGRPLLPEPVVTSYLGNGIRNLAQRSFADAPQTDIDAMARTITAFYLEHLLDQTCLLYGVAETLEVLKRTHKLAVVTNKPQEPAARILEGLGIGGLIDVLVGGGRCEKLKPQAEPLLLALAEARCEASVSWMVGDNWTDIESAANAGVKSCFCRFGFGKLGEVRPDVAIDEFPQLIECVNK